MRIIILLILVAAFIHAAVTEPQFKYGWHEHNNNMSHMDSMCMNGCNQYYFGENKYGWGWVLACIEPEQMEQIRGQKITGIRLEVQ